MPHAPSHRLLLAALISLLPLMVEAQGLSRNSQSELSDTLEQLKQAEREQERLEAERQKVEKELKPLQQEMVGMADKLQKNEQALSKLEEDLSILETSRTTHTRELERKRKQLSQALMAMARLSETPVEAVFAMPGDTADTLRTASLLDHSTAKLERESQELQETLTQIDELDKKIREKQARMSGETKELDASRTALAEKLEERNKLQEKLESDHAAAKEKMASLAQKSTSLRDLIDAIEDSEKLERTARLPRDSIAARQASQTSSPVSKPDSSRLRSVEEARGSLKMPVAGRVVSGYGNPDVSPETRKGLVLQARSKAQVRAPFDGEVVFTGPFRDYGNMVILRHNGSYHTLLAGLARIDCVPGQILLEGEPVGVMGSGEASEVRLYIEFREDGRPIDPAPWITGLSEASSG